MTLDANLSTLPCRKLLQTQASKARQFRSQIESVWYRTMVKFNGRIRLLVIEDHTALSQNLSDFFGEKRYVIDFAADGLTALHLLATNQYDVVALDLSLPGIDGIEICRRIREDLKSTVPVIMMTAKGEMRNKEEGFKVGADDYLVKPFQLRELQLRIEALHRRSTGAETMEIRADSVQLNLGTLEVTIDGKNPTALSGMGAQIFEIIVRAHPNFVPYKELNEKLWAEREVDVNVLRTHVYSLRKLLQSHFGVNLIKTLHGRGYRLNPPKAND